MVKLLSKLEQMQPLDKSFELERILKLLWKQVSAYSSSQDLHTEHQQHGFEASIQQSGMDIQKTGIVSFFGQELRNMDTIRQYLRKRPYLEFTQFIIVLTILLLHIKLTPLQNNNFCLS